MPYHSLLSGTATQTVCGCPILPIKGSLRGPAPALGASDPDVAADPCASGASGREEEDIVDEALRLFRPNVLFRSFPVKNSADRLLIYLTLYISTCLKRVGLRPGSICPA